MHRPLSVGVEKKNFSEKTYIHTIINVQISVIKEQNNKKRDYFDLVEFAIFSTAARRGGGSISRDDVRSFRSDSRIARGVSQSIAPSVKT